MTPDPDTVRMCIEALPKHVGCYFAEEGDCQVYAGDCRKALEALISDPAEELVREWYDSDPELRAIIPDVRTFARWLLANPDAFEKARK